MEDRLDNAAYQEDLSMYNTISVLATKELKQLGSTGTYDMKPAWMNLFSLIVSLHYYQRFKVPLFNGRFYVTSYTVSVSFKPVDDVFLSRTQLSQVDGATIISKNFIEDDGKYIYSRLNEEYEDYDFLKEVVQNLISKIRKGTNVYNLHDELVDFGYMDVIKKHVYPNVGAITDEDYKYMTNKYFKGIEKPAPKKITTIKSSSNVIEFNRTKK